ncbi:YcaO-like family protein [Roseibium alexandrii]|uniref:YcaO-like family protein n=1 Tax=Roseibium alexandrii TaxID=388408 RepID=UPI003750768A
MQRFMPEVLSGLVSAGLIAGTERDVRPVNPDAKQALRLFEPVLRAGRVRLVPVSLPSCPIHFCTAVVTPQNSDEQHTAKATGSFAAGGKANTKVGASISCIGEVAERLTLCSLGQDDPRVVGFTKGEYQPDLASILGFSEAQTIDLLRKRTELGRGSRGSVIDWSRLSNRLVHVSNLLNGTEARLPAFAALFGEVVLEKGLTVGVSSTVGCAVWSDLEGARERAALELVERDAVAQAWYNRLGITLLPGTILREKISEDLMQYLSNRRRRTTICRVETDLPVHVAVAISHRGDGFAAAFGACAEWDIGSAMFGAITEMLQGEISLSAMEAAYSDPQHAQGSKIPIQLRYAREKSILDDWPLGEKSEKGGCFEDKAFSLDGLLEALREKGITVWEFDATRPDLGVPCIKLFSPELCTWQPRFGKDRLFQGVVERGLRTEPEREEVFAGRSFPF